MAKNNINNNNKKANLAQDVEFATETSVPNKIQPNAGAKTENINK